MASAAVCSKISLRNILYATDFSRCSDAALPFALSLARKYGSKILAAHIVSISPFPSSSPTQAIQAVAAQAVREAREAMEHLQPAWNGIGHEKLLRKGDIWKELSKIIQEKQIDLVVIGTHGRTGVSKVLMGSVAERVYRHASCPVLTVGPSVAGEPESVGDIHAILFPTDFSPESIAAARYAISLAKENQARLYLLHVTEDHVGAVVEDRLLDQLRGLIPAGAGLSCAPRMFVEPGAPAGKIAELAEELAVDLIVFGLKRMVAFPGAGHLHASIANYAISRAICPVLTVRG